MEKTVARTRRNHQLDGLRGYAVAGIVIFHCISNIDWDFTKQVMFPSFQNVHGIYQQLTKIVLVLLGGEASVAMFFIMSGLVLMVSLESEKASGARLAANFVVRRLLRIYPALIVCVLIAALVFHVSGLDVSPAMVLSNAVLYNFPIVGASWTLNAEVLVIPYILLCFFCYRRWGLIGLVLGCAAGWVIKIPIFDGHWIFLKSSMICFALGLMIPTRIGATVANALPGWSWVLWLAVGLLAKHLVLIGGINTAEKIMQLSTTLFLTMVYYNRAGWLVDALQRPSLMFLGRISYTFYLANVIFLEPVMHYVRQRPALAAHPLETGLTASILVLALAIPTAYLLTISVEEPAIRFGRWLTRKPHTMASEAKTAAVSSA